MNVGGDGTSTAGPVYPTESVVSSVIGAHRGSRPIWRMGPGPDRDDFDARIAVTRTPMSGPMALLTGSRSASHVPTSTAPFDHAHRSTGVQ